MRSLKSYLPLLRSLVVGRTRGHSSQQQKQEEYISHERANDAEH